MSDRRDAAFVLTVAVLVGGMVLGATGLASATASSPTIISPSDTDGDGSVEVRSAGASAGPSTVRVNVSIGTAGNNTTFVFDKDGDFSATTGDQGVNGSSTNVTVTDGGANDLDGASDGAVTVDLLVDGGSVSFTESDSFVLGITEGDNVTTSPDTTLTSFAVDNTSPSIGSVTTRDAGAATGTVLSGSDASAATANNGQIDQLVVTLSEPVDDSTVVASDFSVSGYTVEAVTDAGTANNDTLVLDIQESGTADTGATPQVDYIAGSLADEAGNGLPSTTVSNPSDGAAPRLQSVVTGDANDDGTVDRLNLTFTESVDDTSLATGDFSPSSGSVDSVSNPAGTNDATAVLAVSGLTADDTAVTPDLTVIGGSVDDLAATPNSGPAGGNQTLTAADGVGPRLLSATTGDANADGTVDRLNLTFTEPVSDASLGTGDVSVSGGSVDAVSNPDGTDDAVANLSVSGLTADDTAVTPDVTAVGGSVDDLAATPNGGPEGGDQVLTPADGAPPAIVAATTDDADGDGNTDRVYVTQSEALDDAASTIDTTTYSLSAGDVSDVASGTADDAETTITVANLSGTSATPDVTLLAGKLLDAQANALGVDQTFTGTTNGASPTVTAVTTLDRDGDGNVDAATVTASAPLDDSTLTPSDWTIGGTAAEAVDTGSTADDDTVQLRITTDGAEVTGTDAKDVTYTPGTAQDTNGNALAELASGDVTETDGATPRIAGFEATTRDAQIRVEVRSSESLDAVEVGVSGPASTTLTNPTVSGSDPYVHTLTDSPTDSGTYTLTLRVAADAAGNDAAANQTATATLSDGGGGGGAPSAPGDPEDRVSSAQSLVIGETDTTLRLSGPVSRVDIRTSVATQGYARATELSRLPSGTTVPADPVERIVDLQVPDAWESTSATVRVSLRAAETTVDPSRLRLAHYDDASDSWETLETQVVSRTDSTIVIEAETPGFSLFAVTVAPAAAEEGAQTTATATATATAEPTTTATATTTPKPTESGETVTATATPASTATPTEGSGPGFGALVATLALVVAALLARRD